MRLLDEQYTRCPFYGVRRMTAWLEHLGLPGQYEAGAAIAQENGLIGNLSEALFKPTGSRRASLPVPFAGRP